MTGDRTILIGSIVEYDNSYWMVKSMGTTFFSKEPYIKIIRYGGEGGCSQRMLRGNPNIKVILEPSVFLQKALRRAKP